MDVLLDQPCVAIFTTNTWPARRASYDRERWPHLFPEPPEQTFRSSTIKHIIHSQVCVTPDGHARVDARGEDSLAFRSTEIVTSDEVMQLSTPMDSTVFQYMHQFRSQDANKRSMDACFGRPYPDEALALLNPLLMLRDYVCNLGTFSASWMLGDRVSNYLLAHNPTFPIDASDDPERLGSVLVDVTFSDSDPIILLQWSALHAGEPFSTTRMTWLRQGVDLDPAIFSDPRVPAPPLPFE